MDRAEWTGTGAALLFHVALIGAMSLSLAHVASVPEPPSMEVDFVEEVGLTSAAPTPVATPAADQSPPIEQAPTAEPVKAAPTPPPAPIATRPQLRPTPVRPAPAKPAPRAPRLGDDFLKGLASDQKTVAAAPTFDSRAKMDIGQAIIRQARACADNQPYLGEGANKVRLTVNLQFNRNGRLSRPPIIRNISGDADLVDRYGPLLEDQVRRIFSQCATYRLPAELYDTPSGGWKDFTFAYRVE